ncbi:putative MFS-type transporter YkuC [Paenibacillus sp. J23TS9]|uniref:MFS transporter n=1 Tax=Paenibacillus sp. J23TS9 TaxID=2807193 RepID=UPI001B192BB9|nr:MFS transporter [Paenibacillus sp. J23TS9]GIP28899.1 putative MFS-type transporter YkuC [Paenibacillus sp. J23TS9]
MELFRNSIFVRMFLATFASQLGTMVGTMAFAFYLIDRFSNQPVYATVAEMMYSLPTLVVFLFIGVLADRLDRKRIAVYSDWIRAGLSLVLLVAIHEDWIIAAFALLFLRSAISKFFAPAEMSLLQGIMKPEQYVQASSLNMSIMGVFMLFGMSMGSAAYYYLGIEGAIIIDTASFIISGILLAFCHFPPHVRQPNGKMKLKDLNLKSIISDFGMGFKYIVRYRLLLAIVLGFFFFGIVNGVFSILPLFTMKYKLSPDQYQIYTPLVMVFLGIGYLVGSAISTPLIKKAGKVIVLITGLFLIGVFTIFLGSFGSIQLYLGMMVLLGIILAPINVVLGGWMPELVEPQSMGRVSAWIEPLSTAGQAIALGFVAIAFPTLVSVTALYWILAVSIFIVSVYYLLVLPSLSRKHQYETKTEMKAEMPG